MNIVIIGGNRGIGFELTRQYKELGHQVTVLCRRSSPELDSLGSEIVTDIDVRNDELIASIANKVTFNKIDILIHNSGILNGDRFPLLSMDNMRESFEVNSMGPLRTILGLKSKLSSDSKVGIVTSRVGSIGDNSSSNNYAYRTSKAAVNMIGKCLSLDFQNQGVAVALLHPGYVRTAMTNFSGLIEPDESARGLIQQMDALSLESSGVFIHTNGEELVW